MKIMRTKRETEQFEEEMHSITLNLMKKVSLIGVPTFLGIMNYVGTLGLEETQKIVASMLRDEEEAREAREAHEAQTELEIEFINSADKIGIDNACRILAQMAEDEKDQLDSEKACEGVFYK
jgi:hypothetical protein